MTEIAQASATGLLRARGYGAILWTAPYRTIQSIEGAIFYAMTTPRNEGCLRRRTFGIATVASQSSGKSRFAVAAAPRSSFSFTWNAVVYDEATLNTDLIAFIALDTATSALFGGESPARRSGVHGG